MMQSDVVLIVTGDISLELATHVSDRLGAVQHGVSVRCVESLEEAHSIPVCDMLSTAAAIAAVLSFVLNVRNIVLESKKRMGEADCAHELDKTLAATGAHGYETESVEHAEARGGIRTVRRVVLRDVPNQVVLTVEEQSEYRFDVKRTIVRSRSSGEG